jgi:hypothetical protein
VAVVRLQQLAMGKMGWSKHHERLVCDLYVFSDLHGLSGMPA